MALSDEDKIWIAERLGAIETRLGGEIEASAQSLRGEIQHAKDDAIAASRQMQTEVIRCIGAVAEPFNVRMRHLEANAGNLETAERLRLAVVEDRLLRIEMKMLSRTAVISASGASTRSRPNA